MLPHSLRPSQQTVLPVPSRPSGQPVDGGGVIKLGAAVVEVEVVGLAVVVSSSVVLRQGGATGLEAVWHTS